MNILIISPGLYPCITGGVEIFNYYFIKELAKRGHRIWILTSCARDWNDSNISLVKLNEKSLINPTLSTEFHIFFALIKLKKKIDIIYVPYTSNTILTYPLLFVKRFFDIHYVVTIHGGGMYPWKPKLLHRLFFRHADAIIGVSETIQKEYERRSGRSVTVIPPLIPFDESEVLKDELRKRYGFDNDDRIILSVGSIREIKGSDILLNAFLELGKTYVEKNRLRLLYVGEGPMKTMLAEKVKRRSFGEYVGFLGIVPYEEMRHIYRLADIYVISSMLEGTPIALLEAMFSGLPIVGADVNGISNLIRNSENGLLFEKKNVSALAERIKELVESKDLCSRLGNAAKRDYLKSYSFRYMISQYVNLFTELCKEND